MGDSALLVADCRTEHCAVHPYRRGDNTPLKERRGASKEAMGSIRGQKRAVIQGKISQNQLSLPGIGEES
jgi:hypothetical protein